MSKIKITSEIEAEELRHALAEYDEAKKHPKQHPKRFVLEKGDKYTCVCMDGTPASVSNDRGAFDNAVIAMGNCFPVDSGLAEKASPMIAECIKAIHCALMCDPDVEIHERLPINIYSPNLKVEEMVEMYDNWGAES